MVYDSIVNEILYDTSGKTFVIHHPIHPEKYLVHACLEGPEAGVYYRGKGQIKNNRFAIIDLPDYVSHFVKDLSVQITQIVDNEDTIIVNIAATSVKNNQFKVCGQNCQFDWLVFGKRSDINVEPNKDDVFVNGSGPYLWIN
jgi:hypothetical protein